MARMNTQGRTAQRGFTLIEVLIAMIVVGLLAALAIPAFAGQREKAGDAAAKSLLRTAGSAVETASVDTGSYAGLDAATLATVEGTIRWQNGPGAQTSGDEVSIIAVAPGSYTLTTTTAAGQTFHYTKNIATQPTVTRTCGPGCSW